jgi:selenocysteine lyase/cysteine desulfurase
VDASQSSGVVPIDAASLGVDALVSTGYKWLCGPFGAAILYLSPKLKNLVPGLVGWRSTREVYDFVADTIDYPSGANRFEFSTMNYGSSIALARSVEYLLDVGIERIFPYCIHLADLLIEGVKKLGGEVAPHPGGLRNSIINVQFPGHDQNKIAAGLNAAGVIVSPRMGGTRISPHLYNSEDDIEKALDVMKSLVL